MAGLLAFFMAANRRIHAWILPHGKDRRVADTFFLILLSSSDSLSLFALSPHERLVRGPLSGLCGCSEFSRAVLSGRNTWAQGTQQLLSKTVLCTVIQERKQKNLDISTEKICLRKNGMGQQLCFHSFIFSQPLTQIFAFLTRIFPHVCQLCVVWRPIYIAARSTDRANESACFLPYPGRFIPAKKK